MKKRMALLVTGNSIQAAYAPWMMAATGAAMEFDCAIFYAFEGLELLRASPQLAADAPSTLPDAQSLRHMCLEQGVRLYACSASLAMRGDAASVLIAEAEVAGMATWLAFAAGAEVQLNFS